MDEASCRDRLMSPHKSVLLAARSVRLPADSN
jgi:hypothetical protein